MAYTEEEKRKNIGVVAQTLVDEGLLDKEDAEEFKRTEPKLAIPGLDKVLKALGAAEANEKTKAAIGTLRQALLEGDKASMTVQKAAAELLGLQAQVKRQQAEADAIARKNSIALAKVGLGHGQGPDGKDLISLEKAEEEGTLRDRLEQLRDVEGGLTTEDITKLSASGKALLDWEKGQATKKQKVKKAVETAKGTQAEAERKRVEAAALAAELAPRLALVGIGDGAGQISI